MAQTSRYQYETFDPTVDGAKKFKEFVEKDSKANLNKLDGDLGRIEDKVDNKNKLDGTNQENFNFIENKVEQNGFMSRIQEIVTNGVSQSSYSLNSANMLNILMQFKISNKTGYQVLILGDVKNNERIRVGLKTDRTLEVAYYDANEVRYFLSSGTKKVLSDEFKLNLVVKGTSIELYIDDVLCISSVISLINVVDINKIYFGGRFGDYASVYIKDCLLYNRPLTQQEIAHNFSVLNNSPSLKSLETTDTTGKKTTILLGSDGDHVEMKTGRTLEQEYMGVLKTLGKEHVSSNGADISVANGVEARVIGAEIQGQTVKSYSSNNKPSTLERMNKDFPLSFKNDGTTKYILIANVSEKIGTCSLSYVQNNGAVASNPFDLNVGLNKVSLVGLYTNPTKIMLNSNSSADAKMTIEWAVIVDESSSMLSSYIPFGLSSTVATISNNGIKYPLYASLEDKAQKKQILLAKIDTVADKLTMNSDGSVVWNDNINSGVLDSRLSIYEYTNGTRENTVVFGISVSDKAYDKSTTSKEVLCNKIPSGSFSDIFSSDGFYISGRDTANTIFVSIPKSMLETPTKEGFLKWINIETPYFIYKLATPTTTTIPKEVNEPIATTDKINILSAGEAVKASSFSVNVPTTDKSAKDFTLTPINGYTGSAMGSLLKNGDYELTLDLTVPATFNQVICNIPVELRPSIDRRMVGFNGDTPITLMVTSAGEVKCPTTITGIIKLKGEYKK